MPRIMAIGSTPGLGAAVGVGAYPHDFGPWVEASDVDAALSRAQAQMQTGRPPGTPVAYKFSPDGRQWTEEYFDAATSQTHTVDHVDATGAPLLRSAYESIVRSPSAGSPIKALGTNAWTLPILLAGGALGVWLIWRFGFKKSRRRS